MGQDDHVTPSGGGTRYTAAQRKDDGMNTAQEWREFYKSPGAQATCMSIDWLRGGCPKCGGKKWQATSDCWVYCMTCNKGYSTDYPFTNAREIITELDYTE